MKLTQKAESLFDLPQGSLSGEARMEIDGDRLLTVEGATAILEYEETCVKLKTASTVVCVTGHDLMLECLHKTGVCLSGKLMAIEFM